jgi:1,4-dihydroxy-2-naphthoate octaprenyltransferase
VNKRTFFEESMNNLKAFLGPMKPAFLILTPACVLLGLGTAVWTSSEPVSLVYFLLVLAGATSAHISVNAFNEYYDFKSGLDLVTRRTPFSGGSGALPKRPDMAGTALVTAWATLGITALIGLYFVAVRGLGLLPLGILGLVVVVAYTNWGTRRPLVCLIMPGLGFGPLMVMGTDFVLTGQYSWTAFIASLVPFFLVNNLLLLNQFPDLEADRSVGRNHLLIVAGKRKSGYVYIFMLILAYLVIGLGVYARQMPPATLIAFLTAAIAIPLIRGVWKYAENSGRLLPYLGMNVAVNILTPVLMAAGMMI